MLQFTDDLEALKEVMLARTHSLFAVRLKKLPMQEIEAGEHGSLEEVLEAVYLDGVRDGLEYLGHLLDEKIDV